MTSFEKAKDEALMSALVAINFAMARQIARLAPDPADSAAWMQAVALRIIADCADQLPEPAEQIARSLVETVFLN